jgi:rhodanese-related sulfurtransferase
MFHSLRRFDDLPDSLNVYPTHGAGSFCSAPGSTERITTLGHERVSNSLFAIKDQDLFVEQLINGFGTFPIYFNRLPELNRLGPNHYEALPLLPQLDPAQVESHLKQGGVVIDVRPSAAFSDGHLAGSISITLRPVLASWLGWIVKPDQPIVFVMDDDQDRNELVRQCFEIGHERLVGELTSGIKSWTNSGRPVEKIEFVEVSEMVGQIIDVRQSNEYHLGHVPTALNIELGSIAHAEIPSGALTIMCGHGERAMTGASILAKHGRTDIVVLNGGSDTWFAATGVQLETE